MIIGPTHRHKGTHCLACGAILDASTGVGAEYTPPVEGDVTVCIVCGHLMIFTADGSLRHPTADELAECQEDERIMAVTAAVGKIKGPSA